MRLRTLKLFAGGIALSLLSLYTAPAAFAQSNPCAGPFDGPNVYIDQTGDCDITTPINVTGTVYITATGKVSDTSTITAGGGQVYINGQSGVQTGTVTASTYIDIRSTNTSNVSTGNVSESGALSAGSYIYLQGQNITSSSNLTAGTYIQASDSNNQTINITGTITSGTTNSGAGGSVDLESSNTVVLKGAVTAGTTTGGTGASVTLKAPTSITTAGITAYDYVYLESDSGTIQSSQAVVSINNYITLIGQNLKSTSTGNSYSAGYYINSSDNSHFAVDRSIRLHHATPKHGTVTT